MNDNDIAYRSGANNILETIADLLLQAGYDREADMIYAILDPVEAGMVARAGINP